MDNNLIRLHLPRSVNAPLDAECRFSFTIFGDESKYVNCKLYGKIVESTIPDDNPDVRDVTISVE